MSYRMCFYHNHERLQCDFNVLDMVYQSAGIARLEADDDSIFIWIDTSRWTTIMCKMTYSIGMTYLKYSSRSFEDFISRKYSMSKVHDAWFERWWIRILTVALYFLLSARTFLCQLTGKIAVTPIKAVIERKNHVV